MKAKAKANNYGVLIANGRILITVKSIIFSGNGFIETKK